MKKIALVFSILVSFLFSFSNKIEYFSKQESQIHLLSNNELDCTLEDSLVNITTINNLINVSGIVVYNDEKYTYIATSFYNYDERYNYEVIFNDFSRKKATVAGYAIEDGILLFKVEHQNKKYCTAFFSKSEYMDVYEYVDIIGKNNTNTEKIQTVISSIGLCKNCHEETYKRYYYSLVIANIEDNLLGAGLFDKKEQLLGIVINKMKDLKYGVSILDVNKLSAICYNLINEGNYNKNYIKYNLLDINSLTNYDKYLYSLDEGVNSGVLVSSIHYLNYIKGGLNQSMIILSVNDVDVNNCYEFDNEISKYKKGSVVNIKAKTITNSYKIYRIKV